MWQSWVEIQHYFDAYFGASTAKVSVLVAMQRYIIHSC